MKDFRWLVAGFVFGMALAVSPACGVLGGNNCSAATCNGCCDPITGACNPGTLNTACGARGGSCTACQANQDCQLGVCTTTTFTGCSQNTCAGCCTANGCNAGNTRAVCGKNGSCRACEANEDCINQECVVVADGGNGDGGVHHDGGLTCGPANCSGCCKNNQCITPSNTAANCGTGGGACQTCSGNQQCNASGTCQDTTCAGCVDGLGNCLTGTSASFCGAAGNSCVACQPGQTCQNGQCSGGSTCSAANCSGCCSGNTCIPLGGQSNAMCGQAGAACVACTSPNTCSNGACMPPQTGCNAANCPNGCCSGSICLIGNTNANCGSGGAACQSCGANQSCQNQQCTGLPPTASVGSACSQNSDCSALGLGAMCKKTTSNGQGTYSGGFCTVPCLGTGTCPTSSECLPDLSLFGENDRICAPNCSTPGSQSTCRTDYACYALSQTQNSCWLNPAPPIAPGGNAQTGKPCTSDSTCQNPPHPQLGFCIAPVLVDGGSSGWTGGSCSADCSFDTTGTFCGSNGHCILVDPNNNTQICLERCSGTGMSTCRSGYVCQGVNLADGGTSGVCWPNCNNPGQGCGGGTTCNANGYCQ